MEASIGDHALVGDGRATALIARDGTVAWMCWPRFDAPSIFGALLDPAAGAWRVAVRGARRTARAYLGDSPVLTTVVEADGGRARLVDLMPAWDEAAKRRRLMPERELVRVVACERGAIVVDVEVAPRPGYGARAPRLRLDALGVRFEDDGALYTLVSDAPLTVTDDAARATLRLRAGERRVFRLAYDRDAPAVLPALDDVDAALDATLAWWRGFTARAAFDGPERPAVLRGLITLKLLSYAPSGGIVAAPTTSLPERLGDALNWDYRFVWLRDAALIVRALLDLGYEDEGRAFVSWLLHTTRLTRPRLEVLYDVYGRRPARERLLPHLAGHRGSRPVRIGNAAADQLQLDLYGEVIDATAQLCRRGARLDRDTAALLAGLGEQVCRHWREPDQGLWEPRGAPRHHTHSRVLCWVALERLLELTERGALRRGRPARWAAERDRIRDEVERRGFDPRQGSYTAELDGATVDASALLFGWYGFAAPSGARMRGTLDRVRADLELAPGLLARNPESRRAGEGAFGICSFWAAEVLARGAGTLAEAERWFAGLAARANDVGLFGEELEPATGEALGNFPQAFTHVGLINAALALEARRADEARRGRRPRAAASPEARP